MSRPPADHEGRRNLLYVIPKTALSVFKAHAARVEADQGFPMTEGRVVDVHPKHGGKNK